MFSASLLLSGLLGPLAGRMINRYGGRDVLVATNVAFAICLVAVAGLYGRDARNAITGITLFAGLRQHGRTADQRGLHRSADIACWRAGCW